MSFLVLKSRVMLEILSTGYIELVNVVKWQTQEVMLILPSYLTLSEAFTLNGGWWWISNLGNKVCRRCLRNAVHNHTDEGSLQNNGKGKRKAEQNAFTVAEPATLLFRSKLDSTEVWFKLDIFVSWFLSQKKNH